MVKVKLMEKSVNNHVGKVMVAKVTSQSSAPGRKVTREIMAWPKADEYDPIWSL